jgi:hypothetical protein
LLTSLDGQDSAEFYPDTCWEDGAKAFDAILRRKKVVVAMEYKGGFLRQDARYSSSVELFMRDLDAKISEGCFQLARNIADLFPPTGNGKTLRDVPIPLDTFCVLPVLVVQDSILRTPFVNYFLNKKFQAERDRLPSQSQVPRPTPSTDGQTTGTEFAGRAASQRTVELQDSRFQNP